MPQDTSVFQVCRRTSKHLLGCVKREDFQKKTLANCIMLRELKSIGEYQVLNEKKTVKAKLESRINIRTHICQVLLGEGEGSCPLPCNSMNMTATQDKYQYSC